MRAVLYSHLFLALCAVSMIAATLVVFDLWNERSVLYLSFVFFSTFVAYNIKGIRGIFIPQKEILQTGKQQWVLANRSRFIFIYSFATGMACALFFLLPVSVYVIVIPMAILAITYSWPVRLGSAYFAPRYIPFFKTFLVAFVWSIIVVYVPCTMNGLRWEIFYHWFVGEFLFLWSLALLFDIKDTDRDRQLDVKTLPLIIGVKGVKYLSLVLMGARVFILWWFRPNDWELLSEAAVCLIYMIYIVPLITLEHEERFYMLWIDGLMIGRLLFFICNY